MPTLSLTVFRPLLAWLAVAVAVGVMVGVIVAVGVGVGIRGGGGAIIEQPPSPITRTKTHISLAYTRSVSYTHLTLPTSDLV